MRRSQSARIALALLGVSTLGAGQQRDVSRLARDPDRGLDEALRKRLALVDPAGDTWVVERWAALLEARLDSLARLWGENGLPEGLAGEAWIARDLPVPPLCADSTGVREPHGEWSFARATFSPDAPAELGLARALAAWRATFPGESRLDFELPAIAGEGPEIAAEIRLTASGPGEGERLQDNATWSTTWRVVPAREGSSADSSGASVESVELVALRPQTFERVRLAQHPQGLFADVTESVFGAALYACEIAPGLDEWRLGLAAALEPGTLGHHGLALGDVNADGREDLYWCRPGGLPNRLFLHAADDGAADASAAAGVDLLDYSSSALLADLDGDADADLLVATGTGLAGFANDGRARFERRLMIERSLATSLAAADYDADGDLDVYVCSYVSPYEKSGTPVPYHDANNGEANALLANDGKWGLTDVTAAAGMDVNNRRFSLAAAWEDYDDDGDPDLYVANDFGQSNLFRNDGGRFRDVAAELGARSFAAGMGVTWGDVDGDGWTDLYVTNLYSLAGSRLTARSAFRPASSAEVSAAYRHHSQGNTLFHNEAGAAFRDVSAASGTFQGRWGWGALFLDLDLDGALDLFAPNGFVTGERRADLDSFFWREVVLRSPDGAGAAGEDYDLGWHAARRLVRQGYSWNGRERNVALLNRGSTRFTDVSSAAGLDFPDDSRAAARVDWDEDGDEDLIVTNRTAPMLRVLQNRGEPGKRWIAFTLRGKERTAVGARVELVTQSGQRLVRTLRCGEGYLAQSTERVHFGLGQEGVERVSVRWPGGGAEDFGRPEAGSCYRLEQGRGRALPLAARATPSRLAPSRPERRSPSGSARTVLPAPLPLPRLALASADGRPASLLGITMQGPRGTGQPLLLVAWSCDGPSSRCALEPLAAEAESLSAAGLQILALNADGEVGRERARAALRALPWPCAEGFPSEEALAILELVQAALHDDARSLPLPSAFLVDPGGRLAATYQGRLEPERVRADLALLALDPEERLAASVPLAGRWLTPPAASFEDTLAARLAVHGLERPASEYRLARVEVRAGASASLQYEAGVVRQREGRLGEAIAHYRKALELDPGHLRAAQNLAVALHQQHDYPAALAAYQQAVKLDAGHALTRSNLGHLYLDLGDVESAKKELAALRALKSELAVKLEARIRQLEKP